MTRSEGTRRLALLCRRIAEEDVEIRVGWTRQPGEPDRGLAVGGMSLPDVSSLPTTSSLDP